MTSPDANSLRQKYQRAGKGKGAKRTNITVTSSTDNEWNDAQPRDEPEARLDTLPGTIPATQMTQASQPASLIPKEAPSLALEANQPTSLIPKEAPSLAPASQPATAKSGTDSHPGQGSAEPCATRQPTSQQPSHSPTRMRKAKGLPSSLPPRRLIDPATKIPCTKMGATGSVLAPWFPT